MKETVQKTFPDMLERF